MPTELYCAVVEATLATTAAVLVVLALRRTLRARLGAQVTYGLWGLVPAALLATLAPAASVSVRWQEVATAPVAGVLSGSLATPVLPLFDDATLSLMWLLGALAVAIWIGWRQHALLRGLHPLIPHGSGSFLSATADGPMLIGSWRPIVVLPLAFEQDFPPEQQALMLAHESAHRSRGDAKANALAALLGCLFWFNPLIWLAQRCFRFDQELACDASVIEARPQARRAYAQAMLQTQLAGQRQLVLLGCPWPSGHPLKERITMLTQPLPTPTRRRLGHVLLLALTLTVSIAVWAAQPSSTDTTAGSARLFDATVLRQGLLQGLMLFVVLAALYILVWQWSGDTTQARTATCAAMILGNLGLILSNLSSQSVDTRTLMWRMPLLRWFVAASALALAMILAVPQLRDVFHFTALMPFSMALIFASALLSVLCFEVVKYLQGRRETRSTGVP